MTLTDKEIMQMAEEMTIKVVPTEPKNTCQKCFSWISERQSDLHHNLCVDCC